MTVTFTKEPIIRWKQKALDIQDLQGSWNIQWQYRNQILSVAYTRIDQVFVIWGVIAILIFSIAQFFPVSWTVQAVLWSMLTSVGIVAMIGFTMFWAQVERLTWLVYVWAVLMLGGALLTDLGVFFQLGTVLVNLCPLWLSLSAIGYFCTGFGIQSRTFVLLGIIHTVSILCLPYFIAWQYVVTGFVIGASLLLLAQVQWDMRSPIDYAILTLEQKEFNLSQYLQRKEEL